jgi:uncharacterized protein (TIGR02266 family)
MQSSLKTRDPEGDGPDAALDADERRRWPRMRLALQVRLRFASTQAVLDSRTVDISPGGVFIRMQRPRPEGTHVRLSLTIAEREMVLAGVVVRSVAPGSGEPAGIGVQFTEIAATDEDFLHGLVAADPP